MIEITIPASCDRCGNDLILMTTADQNCCCHGTGPCDECEPCDCSWHAHEGDKATCVECGLVHYVEVDDDSCWFNAREWTEIAADGSTHESGAVEVGR